MKGTLNILGVVAIFALALSACTSPTPSASPTETSPPMHEEEMPAGEMPEEEDMHEGDMHEEEVGHGHGHDGADHDQGMDPIHGAREIRVVLSEFSFNPSELHLHRGEAVNLVVVNEGVIEHELEITELGLHVHLEAGETKTVGFVAETTGEFVIGCYLPGHFEAGMKATLVVEEAH